ncbi:MAG: hypothetical protein AVDCRST_MAG73-16 [uncultured Thermomicrobiales bacterium]|uniref:Uncharacterized protein n=1 Tax=uncultured Thermomicrobiales bacterium TaxID=1645740 RepID=A0A6J4TAZ0_9BACT|nr:MAG: hypothetical protein AVDCRST_MAG73-16 [uncultured Thermomicrobiales bacterium]
MDQFNGQQDSLNDPAAMTVRVFSDARRAFAGTDTVFLERCAEDAVAALWGDTIKVRSFVPVLALREIREAVAARAAAGATPAGPDRHPAA